MNRYSNVDHMKGAVVALGMLAASISVAVGAPMATADPIQDVNVPLLGICVCSWEREWDAIADQLGETNPARVHLIDDDNGDTGVFTGQGTNSAGHHVSYFTGVKWTSVPDPQEAACVLQEIVNQTSPNVLPDFIQIVVDCQ